VTHGPAKWSAEAAHQLPEDAQRAQQRFHAPGRPGPEAPLGLARSHAGLVGSSPGRAPAPPAIQPRSPALAGLPRRVRVLFAGAMPGEGGGARLVTGGSGYLGSHLVRALLARGERVHAFDVRPLALAHPRLRVFQGDVRSEDDLRRACAGVDTVFHTASLMTLMGVTRRSNRARARAVNVEGTRRLLRVCRETGVARLVYTSSNNVVFDREIEGGDERLPYARRFVDLYSETKALAEQAVLAANGQGGLRTCALRPGGIYGPGEPFVLARMVEALSKGLIAVKVGAGRALSDNVYVDDLVEAHLLAAERLEPGAPAAGRAYFISDGRPTNTFEFFEPLFLALGRRPPRAWVPARPVYAAAHLAEWTHRLLGTPAPLLSRIEVRKIAWSHWFRIDAAARDLGWTPKVPLAEGLARCVPSIREMLAARGSPWRREVRAQGREIRDALVPREVAQTPAKGD
jgi:3beta-hydroxy-delta5-steroid dehydrogenase/steroid delta-isomerase